MTDHWRDLAACAGRTDLEWFPHRHVRSPKALEVCSDCPVREDCLADALEDGVDQHGIRGGLTELQRLGMIGPLRRRPRQALCGTDSGYYRHVRQTFTEPCEACRQAHAVAGRSYWQGRTVENGLRKSRAASDRA